MLIGGARALELPFPANIAAAAVVLAKGAALVASIRSQNVPSFVHGGSFIAGGAPGVDNNLVAVSRGERVDVTPVGEQFEDQGGPVVPVVIRGRSFGARDIEELMQAINR